MEGDDVAKIVAIRLSYFCFFTITCTSTRKDTNVLSSFVIRSTFVESKLEVLLIHLASFVVSASGPSNFK